MEGELRVDSTRIMKSQTVKLLDQQPNPVHVTSPVRQVKLPPLGAGSASTDHDRAVHLEQSKSDVQEAMKHLLKEVSQYYCVTIPLHHWLGSNCRVRNTEKYREAMATKYDDDNCA